MGLLPVVFSACPISEHLRTNPSTQVILERLHKPKSITILVTLLAAASRA